MWTTFVSGLLGVIASANALACPSYGQEPSLPLPQRLLHQFPDGTWVENIAVRPNGNLLVSTSTPNASVYQVSQPWLDNPQVTLVHTFDEYVDRLIGIGESTPDKYVVVGSRFNDASLAGLPYAGTWAAMELDFTGNKTEPTPRLITAMPEAYLLQSVWHLPWDEETVLISSQFLDSPGEVWRLNTRTGDYSLAIQGLKEMNTTEKNALVGINGLKVRGNQLYWVNGDAFTVYKVEIDETGGVAEGAKPEAVAYYDYGVFDDFIFGPGEQSTMWVTGNTDNRLFAMSLEGQGVVVLGNGTNSTFPSPTACAFDNHGDFNTLYVTGRDRSLPINDTYFVGGWVRAVDTTGFAFG